MSEWPPEQDPGPAWPAARWVLLALWLAFVGYMTLSAVQPHNGIDDFLRRAAQALTGHSSRLSTTSGGWEKLSNVALFLPLGVLVTLVLQQRHRWLAPFLCLAASAAVEVLQAAVVTTRQASLRDVALNTVGGVIGWLIAVPLIGHLRRRRRRHALRSEMGTRG